MSSDTIQLFKQYVTNHYGPFPVVFVRGERIYLWDDRGEQYIDAMAGYSAVNHGHCHPRILTALSKQAGELGIVSNSFYTEPLPKLVQKLCDLSGQEKGLIMNTGAEAVETSIKLARKWGYTKKGVPKDKAEIIVCDGNFHGRTTTIVGFSSEPQFKELFGPHAPGFISIPYNDTDAFAKAITGNTVAFLVEPIQGEGGIRVPDDGYLSACKKICDENNMLFIADEIQTGMGRTGTLFSCEHDNVTPDILLLGKSLGGGIGIAVSAILGKGEVMDVFEPGDHGSTFGGTPLATAVALEAVDVVIEEEFAKRSADLGSYFQGKLRAIQSPLIKQVRGRGLFVGIEIDLSKMPAREFVKRLLRERVVSKDAHGVVRLTPPLVIEREEIDELASRIERALVSDTSA